MTEEDLNKAVVDVANSIGEDVSYLSAPGDRNFDSVEALYAFATGVVVAYGTAVLSELGKLTVQGMISICKRVLASSLDSQEAELKRLATSIESSQLTEEEIQVRIETTEQVLIESLQELGMPRTLATTKATSVRRTITTVIKRGIKQ